jgi:hypothetical protein
MEAKYRVKWVGLQETYVPTATMTLLTHVIGIFCPHHELYSLGTKKGVRTHRLSHKNAICLDSIKTTV